VDSFDNFINEHKTLINNLKTEEPPEYTLKYKPYYDSYEIDGMWYPSKRSIRNSLNVSDVHIDNYLSGKQSMKEILKPIQYCYDGVCSETIQGLCLKLNVSINALYKRKQKGMTTEDAIYDLLNNPPSERISSVTVDGVKMSLKAMWEIFGLKNKTANKIFLNFNKDVYAVLDKYGIKTNKTIKLIRMFDN
jgi:hypothetical protein